MGKTLKLCISTFIMCICFCVSQVDVGNAAVKLNNTSKLMEQGDTMTLKISGTKQKVKWTSSNTKIASVTKKGKVKARQPGYATIKATIKRKTLKCNVTVIDANHAQNNTVESFSLDQTELMLNDNETVKLTTKISPFNAIDKNVEWTSFNPSVAIVDQNGNVTGNNKTSATLSTTIQAKCGYFYADCQVTVKGKNAQNTGTANPNPGTSGTQTTPPATNTGNTSSPNTKPDYSWPPSNYPSNNGQCNNPVILEGKMYFKHDELTLNKNDVKKLELVITLQNVKTSDLHWESTHPDVVSVDVNGTIKALKAGASTIRVFNDTHIAKCIVYVEGNDGSTNKPDDINKPGNTDSPVADEPILFPEKEEIYEDEVKKLNFIINDPNLKNEKIQWESSEPSIATVDAEGNVTGIMNGSCEISAICGKYKARWNLHVLNEIYNGENFITYKFYDYKEDGQIIVELQNNYKAPITIYTKQKYYDESEKLIGEEGNKGYQEYIKNGAKTYFILQCPKNYARYDISFKVSKSPIDKTDGLEVSEPILENNLICVNVKNLSYINMYAEITCVFFKDGVPIRVENKTVDLKYIGLEESVYFHHYPYVNFDDCEIIYYAKTYR